MDCLKILIYLLLILWSSGTLLSVDVSEDIPTQIVLDNTTSDTDSAIVYTSKISSENIATLINKTSPLS